MNKNSNENVFILFPYFNNNNSSNQTSYNLMRLLTIFDQINPYSFYFVIGILVSIVGLIGNLLVMISILASKELRKNPTCILCFNIALSDLLMSIFVNGFGKIGN
jgi:hypothetical protein